jgi:prepilin-type N-terminal cleavage/methylation domain-containing protein
VARTPGSFSTAVALFMKDYFVKRGSPGFTFIEVLVVISITVVLLTVIVAFQSDVFSLNRLLQELLISQQEARQVFKVMNWETRSMSPSSIGAYPLAEAATSSLIFYTDLDDDGLKEQLHYFLEGGALKKGVIVPAGHPLIYNPADEKISEVVHNIANGPTSIFAYYDRDYDGVTSPLPPPVNLLAVRLVQVTLLIDSDSAHPPDPLLLTTQMSIRNLKDNL